MKHTLRGDILTREVWLDGVLLDPVPSQNIRNHSPDGFNWGYPGSGPSQLALAICLVILPEEEAKRRYQQFKWNLISTIPMTNFDIEFDLSSDDTILQIAKGYCRKCKRPFGSLDTIIIDGERMHFTCHVDQTKLEKSNGHTQRFRQKRVDPES